MGQVLLMSTQTPILHQQPVMEERDVLLVTSSYFYILMLNLNLMLFWNTLKSVHIPMKQVKYIFPLIYLEVCLGLISINGRH